MLSIWCVSHAIECTSTSWIWSRADVWRHLKLARIDFWTRCWCRAMEGERKRDKFHFKYIEFKFPAFALQNSRMWRWNSEAVPAARMAFDAAKAPVRLENSSPWCKEFDNINLNLYHTAIFITSLKFNLASQFITSLSAITHEGSYVCVVAKELSDPSPNFIIVYDLQSGTLFKKWKPSCNTVSLAISQTNTCVIAGLEDARILIWDLVTGNCRCSLTGKFGKHFYGQFELNQLNDSELIRFLHALALFRSQFACNAVEIRSVGKSPFVRRHWGKGQVDSIVGPEHW